MESLLQHHYFSPVLTKRHRKILQLYHKWFNSHSGEVNHIPGRLRVFAFTQITVERVLQGFVCWTSENEIGLGKRPWSPWHRSAHLVNFFRLWVAYRKKGLRVDRRLDGRSPIRNIFGFARHPTIDQRSCMPTTVRLVLPYDSKTCPLWSDAQSLSMFEHCCVIIGRVWWENL